MSLLWSNQQAATAISCLCRFNLSEPYHGSIVSVLLGGLLTERCCFVPLCTSEKTLMAKIRNLVFRPSFFTSSMNLTVLRIVMTALGMSCFEVTCYFLLLAEFDLLES